MLSGSSLPVTAAKLRPEALTSLWTERLPDLDDDFEEQLVAHIDFAGVVADRDRVKTKVIERVTDIFTPDSLEDLEIWARFSPGPLRSARAN